MTTVTSPRAIRRHRDVPPSLPARLVVLEMLRCAARVVRLVLGRHLHLRRRHLRDRVTLPDGRRFVVYRHTSNDAAGDGTPQTLAVWFRLRGVPEGARIRRWLFERESILNTILYAGCAGYRTKLWMVDPVTSEYAGLYEWHGRDAALRYARYITSVLRPLSRRGSVGFELVEDVPLERYLAGERWSVPC